MTVGYCLGIRAAVMGDGRTWVLFIAGFEVFRDEANGFGCLRQRPAVPAKCRDARVVHCAHPGIGQFPAAWQAGR